jgi:arsenate reductase-like glutaredoxin family protein
VNSGISQQQLEKLLPESEFRILGKNKMTKEFIVQIKEFSPDKIKNYLNQLSSQYPQINKVRLCRWLPPT